MKILEEKQARPLLGGEGRGGFVFPFTFTFFKNFLQKNGKKAALGNKLTYAQCSELCACLAVNETQSVSSGAGRPGGPPAHLLTAPSFTTGPTVLTPNCSYKNSAHSHVGRKVSFKEGDRPREAGSCSLPPPPLTSNPRSFTIPTNGTRFFEGEVFEVTQGVSRNEINPSPSWARLTHACAARSKAVVS